MDRNKAEKSKKGGMRSILGGIIQLVFVAAVVVIAVVAFGNKIPFLAKAGFNFFAVTSGSMEPTIPAGSVIYSGKYSLETLKESDIITYQLATEDASKRTLVTHRIVKVNKEEEQIGDTDDKRTTFEFITRGDANNVDDEIPVSSGSIVGLYEWHVPRVGYFTTFVQTPKGFIAFIVAPAVILIIWEVVSLVLHFKKKYEKKSADEIARLKSELNKGKKDEE